jgi:L-ascorbate 6-phosphate lactonase
MIHFDCVNHRKERQMADYAINEEDMIHPVQSGQQLVDDIASTALRHGQAAIWWLGQSGYAIKTASTLFYVDLYLSEHLTQKYASTAKPHVRITHAPLRGSDLRDVRWVFSSHKHSDHLDPGTLPDILAANPQARLILPQAVAAHAESLGINAKCLMPVHGGKTLQIDGMVVHILPSAHEALDYDETTGYPYLGFVFEVDGLTLYHSGDTVVYDGLAERLKAFNLDIAFLPINGTDDRRRELKVPPNMNIDEALALASRIGTPLVIPHHYDMFTFNTVDVDEFKCAANAADQPYRVLQCGEKFVFKRS